MKEKISALMDGELDERAAAPVLDALGRDREAAETWRLFHVVGDALRGTAPLSDGVTARVAWKLAEEPAVLAPRPRAKREPRRWMALSAAASVAAVALVGWVAFGPQQPAPQIAKAPAPPPPARQETASAPATLPFTSATNDYLLAHQGFASRISLQGMVPQVRTVSETSAEAGK
ncbi:MAG TPA: sigma-E factor negative regulatory protein [Burkholderiales bacterium]|nr:sigma-E factor negative regulatory protein [Burkholderiales bacterium]